MRLALKLVLLAYVAAATWSLTTRFAAWGDGVSMLVGEVARSMMFEPVRLGADSGGGIDFFECMCAPSYSGLGMQVAALALFLGGAPLAVATTRLRRRWLDGHEAPTSGSAQAGFLLQLMTLPLTLLVMPVVALAAAIDGVSPVGAGVALIGLLNIVCGVPALSDWRRLQAVAFGAPRPVLRLH